LPGRATQARPFEPTCTIEQLQQTAGEFNAAKPRNVWRRKGLKLSTRNFGVAGAGYGPHMAAAARG